LSKVEECFKEGLLKKIEPNIKFAIKSLKQAEHFLSEAQDLIELNKKDIAYLILYEASFHAARAILFKDGIKERSHYCISKYLEEKYGEKEIISLRQAVIFDSLRIKRNEIQYSIEKTKINENLNEIYNEVEGLIERIKKIIETHNTK
jgi:uncharacterized protein (UPF0332 family)